ncbi:19570_t:CDS:2, partial [Cetraspora pellucida]
ETFDETLDESNDRLTFNQAIEILSIAEKQMTNEINVMEMECNEFFQDILLSSMNVYGDIWSDNNFSKIKRI